MSITETLLFLNGKECNVRSLWHLIISVITQQLGLNPWPCRVLNNQSLLIDLPEEGDRRIMVSFWLTAQLLERQQKNPKIPKNYTHTQNHIYILSFYKKTKIIYNNNNINIFIHLVNGERYLTTFWNAKIYLPNNFIVYSRFVTSTQTTKSRLGVTRILLKSRRLNRILSVLV